MGERGESIMDNDSVVSSEQGQCEERWTRAVLWRVDMDSEWTMGKSSEWTMGKGIVVSSEQWQCKEQWTRVMLNGEQGSAVNSGQA
jgi:hypothetical protein